MRRLVEVCDGKAAWEYSGQGVCLLCEGLGKSRSCRVRGRLNVFVFVPASSDNS